MINMKTKNYAKKALVMISMTLMFVITVPLPRWMPSTFITM